MKKIAMIVSRNVFGKNQAIRIEKEAEYLTKNGYNITIFAWDREGKSLENEEIKGIKISRIYIKARYGRGLSRFYKRIVFYYKTVEKIKRNNFDIIHCHDFDTLCVGLIIKLFKRTNLIYDIHDLVFYFNANNFLYNFLSFFLRRIDYLFCRLSNKVIVASDGFKEYYSFSRINATSVMTVPSNYYLTNKNNKKNNYFTIFFAGTVRDINSFKYLFLAVQKLSFIRIIIIGEGINYNLVKKLSENYSLNITFKHWQKSNKLQKYYQESNIIFAMYSPDSQNIKYHLPLKLLEALSYKLPVIVSNDTFSAKFVKKFKCGLAVKFGNVDELRNTILLLKNNPKLYNKLGSNGIRLIKNKYKLENEFKKILNIYNKILNKKND